MLLRFVIAGIRKLL